MVSDMAEARRPPCPGVEREPRFRHSSMQREVAMRRDDEVQERPAAIICVVGRNS